MNSVFSQWHEMTKFREDPLEACEKFGKFDSFHKRVKQRDAWHAMLSKLFAQRWFLGYMSPREVTAQKRCFVFPDLFFVFLDTEGNIVLDRTTFWLGRDIIVGKHFYHILENNQLDHLFRCIEEHQENYNYFLDRGHALIYRKEVNRRARSAMDLWTLLGMRAGIPKDIRLLIAKTIWDGRCKWMI